MKMESVSENDLNVQQPQTRNIQSVVDEDIIRRSLETLEAGKVLEKNTQPLPKAPVQRIERNTFMDNETAGSIPSVADNSNYWPIKDLPSGYKLYAEGTMIYGRPLKVLEIKKLSSINAENYDYIINDVLKKAIKGINFEDIYLADKLYIILWLRANSYRDSSFQVNYTCNKCNNKSTFNFDVDNLEVQHLSPTYDPSKDIKLNSGEVIKIKFLTIKDSIAIERFKEINKEVIGEIDDELLSIATMIQEINGSKGTPMEKYNFVLNLSPQDFSYISTYIDKIGMGIKPYMNINCEKCGGTAQLGITFQPDFFFPEYKSE
jgi:hypothetical protein